MRTAVVVVLALTCWPASPALAQRLPVAVTPEHYELAFVVDLARERFEGTETIRVQVARPTKRVVINAVDLNLRAVTIGVGAAAQKAEVALDPGNQTATFTTPRPIARGAADIH